MSECLDVLLRRLKHVPLALAAITADPHFGQITSCAAFFDPKLSATIRFALVNELVPINVADMSAATGSHETDRHNRPFFLASSMNFPLVSIRR
jgi:hypothetical protein